jgi:hypothetical protein
MRKRKERRVLDRINNIDIKVIVPEKTDEINPVKFPVPGFSIEKTETGVAEIGEKKLLYLRLHLKGG